MVNTKGLCAAIALFCVIVPLIVGHCMPIGSEEKTGYVSDNRVNITSDLINNSTIVYQPSVSDINNYMFYMSTPVQVSSAQTPLPVIEWTYAAVNDATIDPNSITVPTILQAGTSNLTFTYDNQSYESSWIYVNGSSMFVQFQNSNYDPIGSLIIRDTFPILSNSGTIHEFRLSPSNSQWISPTEGAYLGEYDSDLGRIVPAAVFINGYANSRVGFLIENLSNVTGRGINVLVSSATGVSYLSLDYNGDGWKITNKDDPSETGAISQKLGIFKQIYLEIDALKDEVRLSALTRSDFYSDPQPRIIKTVSVPLDIDISDVGSVSIDESADKMTRAAVYDADIPVGNQGMISNESLDLTRYYSGKTIMTEFSGIAFYGDSLQLPGMASAATVTDGQITYNDVGGQSHTTSIRESLLICEYNDEGDNYSVYYDNNLIAENVAESDLDIVFGGNWFLNVYLRSASPYTYSEYVFDFTTLNISHNEYCFIGMVTAVIAFVIAALVGKRSGEKATWCLLIAALGFAIYFGLMDV